MTVAQQAIQLRYAGCGHEVAVIAGDVIPNACPVCEVGKWCVLTRVETDRILTWFTVAQNEGMADAEDVQLADRIEEMQTSS